MDIFRTLRFTQAWLDLGIVTPEKLDELGNAWGSSDDRNTEHYRWRAFLDFSHSRPSLRADVLQRLYELGANDVDPTMGGSIMAHVLRRNDCPEVLLRQAAKSEETFLRKIAQQKLAHNNDATQQIVGRERR